MSSFLAFIRIIEGIWEIRVKTYRSLYRIFCFFHGEQLILTNAYAKKSQKTDPQEIARAEAARRDFLQRTGGRKP